MTEEPEVARDAPNARRLVFLAKAIVLAITLVILGRTLASADWSQAAASVKGTGALVVLVFLPFPLGIYLETYGWRVMLRRLDCEVDFARLFRVRIATEALTMAVPAGGLFAEAAGPLMLSPQTPLGSSLATGIAKRWLIVRAHGTYVIAAAILGFSGLAARSNALVGHGAVAWVVIASGVALFALSYGIERGAVRLGAVQRTRDSLAKLTASRWFAALFGREAAHASLDKLHEGIALQSRASALVPGGTLFAQWVLEAVGTFVTLRVLGVEISIQDAIAVEAALSVVRGVAVFAPGGLGVQDLGYLAFFAAYGVPHPEAIGPAFLVLKRVKDVFYVVVGLVLLVTYQRAKHATAR